MTIHFNPWWGCTKCDACCENCYAETFAKRQGYDVWGEGKPRRTFGENHWRQPINWNRRLKDDERQTVFCGSMCDILEINADNAINDLLDLEREKLWSLIKSTPQLDWLLLTKRPSNFWLLPWDKMPSNVWPGVTVGNQESLWRIEEMVTLAKGASVLFVSAEPLLGPIDFGGYMRNIQWIIVGGESGKKARAMHPDWARSIHHQADFHRIPFFFKQWGEWGPRGPEQVRNKRRIYLDLDGIEYDAPTKPGLMEMVRHGRQKTGNLLDGELYQAFPIPKGNQED